MADIEKIRAAIARAGARWEADETPFSRLSPAKKRALLGYVPGPLDPPLEVREQIARSRFEEGLFAPAPGFAAAPEVYDLRDVNGADLTTPIRDQGGCGSCVAFGSAATVESTLKVQRHAPTLEPDLSEAQLFYCYARSEGRNCRNGWWPERAFDSFKGGGVADERCYPYIAGDQNCTNLCQDWQRRATRIANWHTVGSRAEMEAWISTRGPLTACFSVYDDFYDYTSGIYSHVSGKFVGGHCVSVIGYSNKDQCWICKNSWGTGFGEGGYFRILFGQCGFDAGMWAVDWVLGPKNVLTETAVGGPALININDAVIAIGWTGTDQSRRLNVMSGNDPWHFANKVTLDESSVEGPASAYGNGHAHLAWTGTDSDGHINLISSTDCQTFTNKVTLDETSSTGPAIVFGSGRFYLAWTGNDQHRSLNVMSSTDGVNWGNKVTLSDNSYAAPGLAFINGALYLLWSGTNADRNLNVMQSTDGLQWSNKLTFGDDSNFHPTLATADRTYLTWTGRDIDEHLNHLGGAWPGALTEKVVYGDASSGAPSAVDYQGRLYYGWTGTDGEHRLNVMEVT